MIRWLKSNKDIIKFRKTLFYSRLRQYFPVQEEVCTDDRKILDDAEIVKIEWPIELKKPHFGIVCDYRIYPRWTKYRRFLENNNFKYDIYQLSSDDWIDKVSNIDIIVGFISNELWRLQEMREKYYFLEKYMGKTTYPSTEHINLYENKCIEAYICKVYQMPFAQTHISYNKNDALSMIKGMTYPCVSKIIPSSGSMGVELVRNQLQARKILDQAFSSNGRKTHLNIFRQKNYVYFQEYIENNGYDIRIIVVGKMVFGYFRKVPAGDFRASGRNLVEKRELPADAMRIALTLNQVVKSPILVVDMLQGVNGKYYIIEYSPICQMELPEQLHVDGVPGVYIFNNEVSFQFEKGRYWVHELGLREFILNDYLPQCLRKYKTSLHEHF